MLALWPWGRSPYSCQPPSCPAPGESSRRCSSRSWWPWPFPTPTASTNGLDGCEVRLTFILTLVLAAIWATVGLTDDILHQARRRRAHLLFSGPAACRGSNGARVRVPLLELDGGGPGERANRTPEYPDLAYPQHMNPQRPRPAGGRCSPTTYLGLTNVVAFSPTELMPMTGWAKITMAIQSMTSLLILALVIARAVNVLT